MVEAHRINISVCAPDKNLERTMKMTTSKIVDTGRLNVLCGCMEPVVALFFDILSRDNPVEQPGQWQKNF